MSRSAAMLATIHPSVRRRAAWHPLWFPTMGILLTSWLFNAEAFAQTPQIVVGAAADIQYEDRIPGPLPDDIRRWYNTSHIRLDEMVGAWNAQPDIDLVMHLGD